MLIHSSAARLCACFLYQLFDFVLKDGIKPMWEDDRNKLGGRWLMTLNKQQRHNDLDRYWMETVRALFTEQAKTGSYIATIVMALIKQV